MHFTVLVVGAQFGWEEVDELLFPYWFYPGMISETPTITSEGDLS